MKKQLNMRNLLFLVIIIVLSSAYTTIADTLIQGVFTSVVTPDPIKLGFSNSIQCTLSEASTVSIKVFKNDGSTTPVKTLLTNVSKPAGSFTQSWDGKDNSNVLLPDGQYRIFFEAKNGDTITGQVEKVILAAKTPTITNVTDNSNPFNPLNNAQAKIDYTITSDAIVTVSILKGTSTIRTFDSTLEVKPAGPQSFTWDGKDNAGQLVSDGAYTYQIEAVSPTVSTFKTVYKLNTIVEKDNPTISTPTVTPDPLKLASNTLTINYSLSENAKVTLKILDKDHNVIQTLLNGISKTAGSNSSSWNGKDSLGNYVPEGVYKVTITAIDNYNNPSDVVTKDFTAAFQPAISNLTVLPSPFNPKNNEQTVINYTLSKDALVTISILRGTTTIATLQSNLAQAANTYTINWDGKDNAGNVIADGTYTVQIDAVSPTVASFKSTAKANVIIETSNPEISGVTVSPNPLKLGSNSLSISYVLSESAKVTIDIVDSANNVVMNLVNNISKNMGYNTASWTGKTSLGNYAKEGQYTVRIKATDSAGKPASEQTTSFTAGFQPTVSGIAVSKNVFDPLNGEESQIDYTLNYDAKVTLTILKNTTVIKTITTDEVKTSGQYSFKWDGKDNANTLVGDGSYSYQIDVVSPTVSTFKNTYKGTITVESQNPSISDVSIVPTPVKAGSYVTIRYNLSEAATIAVTIRNGNGIVKQFANSVKSSSGSYSLSWDTKDDSGNYITGGDYTLEIVATDNAGKAGSAIYLFQVGAVPVISNVAASPSTIDVNAGQKSTITFNLNGESNITINFYDSNNVLWNTYYTTANGLVTYAWDGVNQDGVTYKQDTFKFTISAISVIGNYSSAPVSGTVTTKNIPIAGRSCTECHNTYPSSHPVTNCAGCHGGNVPVNDCRTCHKGQHTSSVINFYNCTTCHNETYAYKIPSHPANLEEVHISTATMTSCSTCHQSSLIYEHQGRTDETGKTYDCDTCHSSTNETIINAIATKDTNCATCHPTADHSIFHITNIGVDCQKCHNNNIALTHSERGLACDTCHKNTNPVVQDAIKWGQRACSNCHTAAHGQTLTSSIPGSIPKYASAITAVEWMNPISLEYWAGETWVPNDEANGYLILTKRSLNLPKDEVFNFYLNEMQKLGWVKISGPTSSADKFELVYTKDNKKAYIRYYNTERFNTSNAISAGSRIEILYK